jgi:hypothetical protein
MGLETGSEIGRIQQIGDWMEIRSEIGLEIGSEPDDAFDDDSTPDGERDNASEVEPSNRQGDRRRGGGQ